MVVGVIKLLLGLLGLGMTCGVLAQAETGTYRMTPNKNLVEIDILGNYYEQDGNFGAPQGGLGTEQLDNLGGIVVVRVPLDSNTAIAATAGVDYYSSASTDRIDYQLSTASASDLRKYGNISVTQRDLGGGRTYGARVGISKEYDYFSLNGGLSFAQEWARGQHQISLGLQAFADEWLIILPDELRRPSTRPAPLDGSERQSYNFSAAYAGILSPRMQMAITAEVTAMRGLLSTPFHRIYFEGVDEAAFLAGNRRDFPADDIERLPNTRYKFPLSLRLNYKVNDVLTLRTFGRYYTDSWEVSGTSFELEAAYQMGDAWTVLPYARYYVQQASEYYAGFGEHLATERFYTSDVDLADFTTTKLGLGFRYAPIFGLARTRLWQRGIEWRQVSFRGAYYTRSLDFSAYSLTVATSLAIRKLSSGK